MLYIIIYIYIYIHTPHIVINPGVWICPGGGFSFSARSPRGVKIWRFWQGSPGGGFAPSASSPGGVHFFRPLEFLCRLTLGVPIFMKISETAPGVGSSFLPAHPGGGIFRASFSITPGGGFYFSARLSRGV